jgi:hypothetical protein
MTASNESFPPLTTDSLSIVPVEADGVLRIAFSGAVDMRDPGGVLTPYWTALDAAVRRRGLQRVEVDMRYLSFMNSSGILTLVRWIVRAKEHAAYVLALLYDRNVTWQRTSIPTLAKLAPHVVVPTEVSTIHG